MLQFVEFSGTPFQIGLALGRHAAAFAQEQLTASAQWQALAPWRGTQASQAMQQWVRERHPHVWDELQGLARGLGLPAEDVFLWNCRGDLPGLEDDDGCTTILQPTEDGPRLSHNQDGAPFLNPHCALAQLNYEPGPAVAAFVYPASLPGNAFSVTGHGLAMTVNPIRPRALEAGLPRRVLARTLLDCDTLSAAIACLQRATRAGGYHLGLAQRGGTALLSVEFTGQQVSVQHVAHASLHASHIVHEALQDAPQDISDASRYRQIDGTALLARSGADAALAVLGDGGNAAFPIYRDPASDDASCVTLATADIRVGADAVLWDVHYRPQDPPCFRMQDARHR